MMCCMYHYSDVFFLFFFFFNDTATTEIYTLSLHDALPIWTRRRRAYRARGRHHHAAAAERGRLRDGRPRVHRPRRRAGRARVEGKSACTLPPRSAVPVIARLKPSRYLVAAHPVPMPPAEGHPG